MNRYTLEDAYYNRFGELVEVWYDHWRDEYIWEYYDEYGYLVYEEFEFADSYAY